MRRAMIGFMVFALTFLALSMGRASDGDETVVTAKVSSAEHESEEGYFALGRKVRVSVTAIGGEQLSRLER